MSTPLTGHPDSDLSPIDHLWDIRDRRVHDLYPIPAATLPEWYSSWLSNDNAFHRGIKMYTLASSNYAQFRITECINKGVSHTR